MNEMNVAYAQYAVDISGSISCIKTTINGTEVFVPLDPANRHYAEIMRQVEAGELVIEPADVPE